MPRKRPTRRPCPICGEYFAGTGKYCPPETGRNCRAIAKKENNADNKRMERSGVRIRQSDYGSRLTILKDAYKAADPEKRQDMREMHPDMRDVFAAIGR